MAKQPRQGPHPAHRPAPHGLDVAAARVDNLDAACW